MKKIGNILICLLLSALTTAAVIAMTAYSFHFEFARYWYLLLIFFFYAIWTEFFKGEK